MEENRLYIGNLAFDSTEADLKATFGRHGVVTSVKLVTDRDTGRSRGFAFVELADIRETDAAIEAMDGIEFLGRTLLVKEAFDRR